MKEHTNNFLQLVYNTLRLLALYMRMGCFHSEYSNTRKSYFYSFFNWK